MLSATVGGPNSSRGDGLPASRLRLPAGRAVTRERRATGSLPALSEGLPVDRSIPIPRTIGRRDARYSQSRDASRRLRLISDRFGGRLPSMTLLYEVGLPDRTFGESCVPSRVASSDT